MTALLLASTLTGSVSYYHPGVMAEVYANRLHWRQVQACASCVGMIAVEDCQLLGKHATLQRRGRVPEGPFLIADCGNLATPGRIAEVDWQTAQRWQMRGPLAGVTLRLVAPQLRRRVPRGGLEVL